MKSQMLHRLQLAPLLSKKDFLLTLVPVLLWIGGVFARPYVISPVCVSEPARCAAQSVLNIDQPGLGLENSQADGLSDMTQKISGLVAFTGPALWNGALASLGKLSPAAALAQTGVDLALITQTVAWNGVFTESARLISQRPRPYVYGRPAEAANPANYTSFYSGHTSFTAAAMIGLFLVLLGRGAPAPLLIFTAGSAQLLIFSTALFRVLAGRHFLSDVLAGALAGSLVALAVALLHRPLINAGPKLATVSR